MAKYIIVFILSLLALKTCKTTKANHDQSQIKLQQQNLTGEWKVINIQGIDSISKSPTLIFDTENNTINGNAGCNSYGGTFIIDGYQITFKKGFSTKMYCKNMNVENAYFEKLQKVTSYIVDHENLKFLSTKNRVLLTCIRKEK